MFFVASALAAPVAELIAVARGRSSADRWRTVAGLVSTALLVMLGIVAMGTTLYFASRVIASDGLSPFWRRVSDTLVMVLLAIWAASVMVIFVGLDFIRQDRRRPVSAGRASAAAIVSAALPPAMPGEAMPAETAR
jgi:hypothetical protein